MRNSLFPIYFCLLTSLRRAKKSPFPSTVSFPALAFPTLNSDATLPLRAAGKLRLGWEHPGNLCSWELVAQAEILGFGSSGISLEICPISVSHPALPMDSFSSLVLGLEAVPLFKAAFPAAAPQLDPKFLPGSHISMA